MRARVWKEQLNDFATFKYLLQQQFFFEKKGNFGDYRHSISNLLRLYCPWDADYILHLLQRLIFSWLPVSPVHWHWIKSPGRAWARLTARKYQWSEEIAKRRSHAKFKWRRVSNISSSEKGYGHVTSARDEQTRDRADIPVFLILFCGWLLSNSYIGRGGHSGYGIFCFVSES